MSEKPAEKDFETALKELEERVKALEEGNLPLDQALKVFEEGVTIADFCSRKLHEAEQKVEVLLKDTDGRMRREPFPADDTMTGENGD